MFQGLWVYAHADRKGSCCRHSHPCPDEGVTWNQHLIAPSDTGRAQDWGERIEPVGDTDTVLYVTEFGELHLGGSPRCVQPDTLRESRPADWKSEPRSARAFAQCHS